VSRPVVPFDYFESLSAKNKRIYRASDAVAEIALPEPALDALRIETRRLHGALSSESHRGTSHAARELVRTLCESLAVPTPEVRVHEVRPSGDYGELHGLYTRWEDGRARLELWMRTAVNQRPVAFRTFLRTLAHEVVHHLDYVHLALVDSFHTEGFFKRESSLVRQLDVAPREPSRRRPTRALPPPDETPAERLARLRAAVTRKKPRAPGTASPTGTRAQLALGLEPDCDASRAPPSSQAIR